MCSEKTVGPNSQFSVAIETAIGTALIFIQLFRQFPRTLSQVANPQSIDVVVPRDLVNHENLRCVSADIPPAFAGNVGCTSRLWRNGIVEILQRLLQTSVYLAMAGYALLAVFLIVNAILRV